MPKKNNVSNTVTLHTTTTATTTTTTISSSLLTLTPQQRFSICLNWWLPFCDTYTLHNAETVSKAFAHAIKNVPLTSFDDDMPLECILRLQHRFRGDKLFLMNEGVDDKFIAELQIPSLRELMLQANKLTNDGLSRLAMPSLTLLSLLDCSHFTQSSLDIIAGVLPQLSGLGLSNFPQDLNISIFKHLTLLHLRGRYVSEVFATVNPQAPLKTLFFQGQGEVIRSLNALRHFTSTLTEITVGGDNAQDTEWLRDLDTNTALKRLTMADMGLCHAHDFQLFNCHLSHFSLRWSPHEDMLQVLEPLHMDCLETVEMAGRPGPVNLEPLRKATKLKHVEVIALDDLAIFEGAQNLQSLRVNGVGCLQMTQLSFATVSTFSFLERLELMCCPLVVSLKPLEHLKVLTDLMLSKMNSLTSLQGLPLQLKSLHLAGLSNLVDISPLPLLTQLNSLNLHQLNKLQFSDLLPLSSLSTLTSMTLEGFGNNYIPRNKILKEIEIKQMNDASIQKALSDRKFPCGHLADRAALIANEKDRWNGMTAEQRTEYRKWNAMSQKEQETIAANSKISWDFLLHFPLLAYLWVGSPAMDYVVLAKLVALLPSTKLKQVMIIASQEQFPEDILNLPDGCCCGLRFDALENHAENDLPIYW